MFQCTVLDVIKARDGLVYKHLIYEYYEFKAKKRFMRPIKQLILNVSSYETLVYLPEFSFSSEKILR